MWFCVGLAKTSLLLAKETASVPYTNCIILSGLGYEKQQCCVVLARLRRHDGNILQTWPREVASCMSESPQG